MPYKDKELGKVRAALSERRRRQDPVYLARKARQAREQRARNPESTEHMLWRSAKDRAKALGLAFDLSPEDIHVPPRCPLLGVALSRNVRKGPKQDSPSLDRIDPQIGYVRGNVWVVSFRANAIKQNARPEELRRIADGVEYMLFIRSLRTRQ